MPVTLSLVAVALDLKLPDVSPTSWPATMFAYYLDRDLDMAKPWFKSISFKDNAIDLAGSEQTTNLGGWWPPSGSIQSGQPVGPVPAEPVASQIFFFKTAATVAWVRS